MKDSTEEAIAMVQEVWCVMVHITNWQQLNYSSRCVSKISKTAGLKIQSAKWYYLTYCAQQRCCWRTRFSNSLRAMILYCIHRVDVQKILCWTEFGHHWNSQGLTENKAWVALIFREFDLSLCLNRLLFKILIGHSSQDGDVTDTVNYSLHYPYIKPIMYG